MEKTQYGSKEPDIEAVLLLMAVEWRSCWWRLSGMRWRGVLT